MGIIVLFGGGEGGGIVGDWVASLGGARLDSFVLGEDSPYSILQGVGLEVEGLAKIGLV